MTLSPSLPRRIEYRKEESLRMVGVMELIRKGLIVSCAHRVQNETKRLIKKMILFIIVWIIINNY
jgi:hypothetical protein